jgi:glycosyltransferase involved in cell wall biosynthesis
MRILAVTPYYAPEGGGLERYAQAILSRLAARGHLVETMSFTRDGLADGRDDGVSVQRTRASMTLGNTPLHAGFYSKVARRIREMRPDIVVAHTPVPFPAEMAFLAARRAKVPFVVTYHAGALRGSSAGLAMLAALDRHTLERRMIAEADHLIAVGPYVRDNALARAKAPVTVIPPGVDLERYRCSTPPLGRDILFVAPLDQSYHWKGVDVLWRAFERVRREMPDATLTLVGCGDRLEEFRRRVPHTPRSVRVLGRLPDDQLRAEYRRAAVIALPSTTDAESFGMVLAEANACGRPVVASRIGGIPDFVRHGHNGLLVDPGSHEDLSAKLLDVLGNQDSALDMGARGRETVLRHHDWKDLAVRTEAAFEQAIA